MGKELLASNAFVLLTSDYFPFSKTQCAVFKGNDRAVFLDKREYTGPIYEQIEESVDFVLRNIRLGVKIKGLQREESYELPPEAIREMIVNAHCHRNYTGESCVQVAIYDDRLEVTSPGGLYNGLTFEEALQGHSKLRNRAIANVFSQMGLVEAWGTGLQRIRSAAREYGLPDPEFIETAEMFRVNLFRKNEANRDANEANRDANDANPKVRKKEENEETRVQNEIIQLLKENSAFTQAELAKRVGLSRSTIQRIMKKMVENAQVVRIGKTKGIWKVN